MTSGNDDIVLQLTDGIRFQVGTDAFAVQPFRARLGEWIALVPEGPMPVPNPASILSWILATMQEPILGAVELFGLDVYRLPYGERQRLRSRMGYVHGYGGLLSARTVAENIALPVSIYGGLRKIEESARVEEMISIFSLENVAHLKPHEMDGATRWRVCLARALALRPTWLVLEGLGNWEMYRGRGVGWQRIVELQRAQKLACVICLASENPGFENWLEKNGGTILRYTKYE